MIRCNHMASTTTQVIATRIPNDLADRVREEAGRTGDTVSAVAGRYIRAAIEERRALQVEAPRC